MARLRRSHNPAQGAHKMKPKNTVCLWFDKDAHDAARFYAATFPDSEMTAAHTAPSDYPGGKEGDVLTVEFTVDRFRHCASLQKQKVEARLSSSQLRRTKLAG